MLLSNPFKPDLRVLRESLILSSKGFYVIIIAWDREGTMKKIERISDNIVVIRVRLRYRGRGIFFTRFLRRIIYTLLFNLIATIYAKKFLADKKTKIIHCHDFDTIIAGLLIKYSCFSETRKMFLILDSHEYWPGIPFLESNPALKSIIKLLHNVLIKLVDAVITISEALSNRIPSPLRGIKVVFPNIFLPEEIKERVLINRKNLTIKEKIRIFYYGSLHKARGILQLVKLGLLIKRSDKLNAEIIIAGKGPLEKIVKLASNKRLIRYLGWVSEDNIRELLKDTHFTWIIYDPKIENNQVAIPNKFFLSLLYGTPIITNHGLFIARLVNEAKVGIIVNYERAHEEVYQKLIELSTLYSAYSELSKNINEMLRKMNLLVKKYIDNFLKLFYLAFQQ